MDENVTYLQAEHKTVSVLGWRLDRTFTLANVIQIMLLLTAVVGGGISYYYGASRKFEILSDGQDQINHRLNDNLVTYSTRVVATDTKFGNLESRLTAAEIRMAGYDADLKASSKQRDALVTKIDNLDAFLRAYLANQH